MKKAGENAPASKPVSKKTQTTLFPSPLLKRLRHHPALSYWKTSLVFPKRLGKMRNGCAKHDGLNIPTERAAPWAFFQLRSFISYKDTLYGVPVLIIDPAYTSRTCNQCGHCEKANRKSHGAARAVGVCMQVSFPFCECRFECGKKY